MTCYHFPCLVFYMYYNLMHLIIAAYFAIKFTLECGFLRNLLHGYWSSFNLTFYTSHISSKIMNKFRQELRFVIFVPNFRCLANHLAMSRLNIKLKLINQLIICQKYIMYWDLKIPIQTDHTIKQTSTIWHNE